MAALDPVDAALIGLVRRVSSAAVVDVGGGSCTRAVPLARLGCSVLVIDSSIDALAMLGRRAADAGVADRITAIQGDAAALALSAPQGRADLVLCHHLLETVDDPAVVVAGIAGVLKPTGIVSVLAAGRLGAVLAQAVAGRFSDAAAILADPDGRYGSTDPLRRRFDVAGLRSLLDRGDLSIESITGFGVVAPLVPGGTRPGTKPGGARPGLPPSDPGRSAGPVDELRLAELETDLGGHHQLREIAADLHAVARRSGR